MKEAYENLWTFFEKGGIDAVIVTTNGVVKKNGSLVMGAGIAKQCTDRCPNIEQILGSYVAAGGNFPYLLKDYPYIPTSWGYLFDVIRDKISIITMPTKTHFKEFSKLDFVVNQAILVNAIVEEEGYKSVISITPGCGHGRLSWDANVKPELDKIWDSRYTVVMR